ncbi:DUF1972 domain-containing protein [Maribacter sp. TH_r10]|uniref:DUF1972 domain-containing protein n=1 Tax=Maribacter sp. TH_r10 TaxID=3082086 RepID=UPI002952E8C2|nr:DUF1972 domain-containing protein [Maribacter sp. TH_r10]MDV7140112.1 DUF1972 domain-containing protein [Maribacter sp. TH_r10]
MTKKKKVAIIGSVGLPANYGGFETMVYYLTKEKNSEFDITVFCEGVPKEKRLPEYHGCTLKYLPFKANGGQSILYDITAMGLSWFTFDILLILGTPGCIILPFFKLFKKPNIVVNFGGLEWKRDKWGAFGKWYLKLTEKLAIKHSSVIVADNQHFCDYIEEEYQKKSALIEYGGDHTAKKPLDPKLLEKYPYLKGAYDVSVSRAQVDNNLHMVLEAYTQLPDRNLVLVSNYDKFEYGRELKVKYAGYPNIYMQDAVYDLYELDVIRSNASLYIHSHTFCGTAPSLVEAMSLNLPIIAFSVPTNHFTTEEKALYFSNSNELVNSLKNLSPIKLKDNALNMSEIAERRYTWTGISNKYAKVFNQ